MHFFSACFKLKIGKGENELNVQLLEINISPDNKVQILQFSALCRAKNIWEMLKKCEISVYAQYCIAWARHAAALVSDPSIRAQSTQAMQNNVHCTADQINTYMLLAYEFRFLLQRRRITSACKAHRYITWHAVRVVENTIKVSIIKYFLLFLNT